MSAVAGERVAPPPGGPSLTAKVCAVAVVLALAALAAYTVFAGPTTVPIKGSAPTQSAPQAPRPEPEGEGATGD